MSKRIASLLMLLVLVSAVLAACGAPTTTTTTTETTGAAGAATTVETTAAETTAAETATEIMAETAAETATTVMEETATTAETATAGETATEVGMAGETATAGATAGATAAAEPLPNVGGLNLGPIKIASQSPLSGPQAQFGGNARNGAELGIQQLGQQMGFTNVQFAPFDDQAQEPVGAANASTIAADQQILCVVGHVNSGVALAALPTYRDANLVMISPANTNPRVTEEFDGTGYRVVGRDDVQGVVAADFAKNNLNAQNAYVLHDQTAYGEGLATVFRDHAQSIGINIAGFAGTQETSVFDAVLTPIQAANPDLVFFGGIYDRGGPLVQQMRERGIQAKFLGGDGLDASDFVRLGGEGAVGANYVTVSGPASAYPAAAQFIQDYQAKYNQPAAYPAFQAYDSAQACLRAIANAAIDANGMPTREQVKAALEELGPYDGVTGRVAFNDEGDRDPATYYIFEVASADPAQWANNRVAGSIEAEPPAGD
ncbi:MAG: branched-chain amino acid ABC transporter substrate-binding protein [Chloroflexota bacterium]|nr:branched-chain amino acid ABC transporter substrate-binding protein [Chloroflexota bacterium]